MKPSNYVFLFVVIALCVFAALIAWTLIVKNQVSATLNTATQSNPYLALLTGRKYIA